jgi:hypothetical protein
VYRALCGIVVLLLLVIGCAPATTVDQAATALPDEASASSKLQVPASLQNEVIVHERLSAQVRNDPVPEGAIGQTGLGYVLIENLSIPPDQRPQNDELLLPSGTTFSMFLILLNNTDAPKTFLVTTLLNYRQVSFTLDEQAGLLHLLTVPANTDSNIPIAIEVTEAGRNDLQVVAFDDPFNPRVDIDYRSDIQAGIISRRTTIIAGQVDTPARTLEYIDTNYPPSEIGPVNLDVMFFKRDATQTAPLSVSNRTLLYTDTLTAGQPYPFQMVLSNVDEDVVDKPPTERAVVVLYNYRQITLDGRDVILARLNSQEEAYINAELPPTTEPGVHQLQAVIVHYPFADLLQDDIAVPTVRSSLRMALVLR